MALLFADENFPSPVSRALRRLGHDVLTLQDISGQSLPDPGVLAEARTRHRALLTLNRKHFIRLHQQQPDHHGIIVCTFDADFRRQARRIDEAIRQSRSLDRQLLRIQRGE